MSYEYGNNGSYGGLGNFWNAGPGFGAYEYGQLGHYGGLESYWGFAGKGKGKGGKGSKPKFKKPKLPKLPKMPKMHKPAKGIPAKIAAKIAAKLPPKAVAKMQAEGIIPPPVASTPADATSAEASDDAAAAAAETATQEDAKIAPVLYPAPGMLMPPGMMPQGSKRAAPRMLEQRTITPQQARLAQIAAGLAAGLFFL